MGQLTLELDEQTEVFVKQSASNSGMSVNTWVIKMLRTQTEPIWPEEVRALAGAWRNFPLAEELRKAEGQDIPRESF
ncbi:MAG: CopG family transcriptional regulator [Gammaproteobacteria bacterium]|nr:CopG family transcriptional regulator [Gammaproteobacteria bacterium]